ncbi:capsule biosynthesis GfcC family protein [Halomonas organivorans]
MTDSKMRHFVLWAALSAAVLPGHAMAQPERMPPTLVEAWLAWQEERQATGQPPFDWAYSVALRERDATEWSQRRARLLSEMMGLERILLAAGRPDLADTLGHWAARLERLPALPARTADERLDLPALAGDLRANPAISEIRLLGTCRPPAWIEAWTLAGVSRQPWHPGLTAAEAVDAWPDEARRGIDRVTAIGPNGNAQELGTAAWNREDLALAPGARLVTPLPSPGPGQTLEADLIHRELVAFLASRLPGDDCTLWQNQP